MKRQKSGHYWNSQISKCDCGCTQRAIIGGSWICLGKLKDLQNVSQKAHDLNRGSMSV